MNEARVTPAEHAARVEEWLRSRVSILDGPESRLEKSKAGRASLAALVAQAERAERAEQERDEAQNDRNEYIDIAEGLEARNRELVAALKKIARADGITEPTFRNPHLIARAVLAADPETRPA